jgi:putative DNA primase/helicase
MKDGIEHVRTILEQAEHIDPGVDSELPDDEGGHDIPQPPDTPVPEIEGATFPLNDTGNGQRLAHYFGTDLRHVHRVGWFVWDGRHWKPDEDEVGLRTKCQQIQHKIIAEIPYLELTAAEKRQVERLEALHVQLRDLEEPGNSLTDEERSDQRQKLQAERDALNKELWKSGSTRARHRTFAKSAGNSSAIKNMALESTVLLSSPIECLDSDPLMINTETCLLRFEVDDGGDTGCSKTASLSQIVHQRELPGPTGRSPQLISRMMPVRYDPDATCPQFDQFLRRIQPQEDMRRFLQRWFGLSMTGLRVQKFAFFYGDGANGKSVLTDLMARMLDGYAHSAKIESFTGDNRRRGNEATPDIFPLVWARMVRAAEPEEGRRLQEGLIKELTGGERILVRLLNQNFVEAHPFFKLTMSGNHKPDIRGTDDGIWRRVLLVLFAEKIPPEERDEHLIDKLWEERSGILNWLIDGLIEYLEGGLQEPAAVLSATEEYRQDSDPVGRFLDSCCEITGDSADRIDTAEMGRALNLWLALNGISTWTPNTTGRRLNDRAGKHRTREGKTYNRLKSGVAKLSGIRLTSEFRQRLDEAPRDRDGQPVPTKHSSGVSGEEDAP